MKLAHTASGSITPRCEAEHDRRVRSKPCGWFLGAFQSTPEYLTFSALATLADIVLEIFTMPTSHTHIPYSNPSAHAPSPPHFGAGDPKADRSNGFGLVGSLAQRLELDDAQKDSI